MRDCSFITQVPHLQTLTPHHPPGPAHHLGSHSFRIVVENFHKHSDELALTYRANLPNVKSIGSLIRARFNVRNSVKGRPTELGRVPD